MPLLPLYVHLTQPVSAWRTLNEEALSAPHTVSLMHLLLQQQNMVLPTVMTVVTVVALMALLLTMLQTLMMLQADVLVQAV